MIDETALATWLTDVSSLGPVAAYVVKATLLLLLAWGTTRILHRAPASARHRTWLAALIAILALPLLAMLLPTWQWNVLPTDGVAERGSTNDRVAEEPPPPSAVDTVAVEIGTAPRSPGVVGSPRPGVDDLLFLVWAVGAGLLVLRLVVSAVGAWHLVRRATEVKDEGLVAEVTTLTAQVGLRASVRVVESERLDMPMAWGLNRRTVLLPVAARRWSEERRRVVLLHELAHLARRDCETLMLARFVAALHWFNPLVWMAVRRLQAEREHACDDLVLEAGTAGTDYADHLLAIARAMQPSLRPGWAMVAMARPSELEGRLLAILDSSRDRSRRAGFGRRLGVVAMLLSVVPLAVLQPAARVVAAPPQVSAASAGDQARPSDDEESSSVDGRLVATMIQTLGDPDPTIRAQAAHTLGMLEATSAIPALAPIVRGDADAHVRAQTAWALGMIEDVRAVEPLRAALSDADSEVRRKAAWALGMIEAHEAVSALVSALGDDDPRVREQAVWALGMIESAEAASPLGQRLRADDDIDVRQRAAWALGMIASPEAVPSLLTAVEGDSSSGVRDRAAWALGMIGSDAALDVLLDAMTDESEAVRQRALWAVGQIAGS